MMVSGLVMVWKGQEGVSATFWATLSVRRSDGLDREVDDQVDVTQPLAWFDIFPPTPYRVGFRRDEQRRRFDEGLRMLRESGDYQRIERRYLTD